MDELHKQATIENALQSSLEMLTVRGWHVVLDVNSIKLHSFFKNGKPRKTPDVSLEYEPFIIENDFDLVTGEIVYSQRPSARPYVVRSKRMASARTFAILNRAVEAFSDESHVCSPTP